MVILHTSFQRIKLLTFIHLKLSGFRNIVPMEPVFNSVGRVEMRFKSEKPETEEDLKYLPDISTVYVGDKFYMLLKYMGQQGKLLKKMLMIFLFVSTQTYLIRKTNTTIDRRKKLIKLKTHGS